MPAADIKNEYIENWLLLIKLMQSNIEFYNYESNGK